MAWKVWPYPPVLSLTFPSTVQKDLEGASLPNSLQSLVLQGVHLAGWPQPIPPRSSKSLRNSRQNLYPARFFLERIANLHFVGLFRSLYWGWSQVSSGAGLRLKTVCFSVGVTSCDLRVLSFAFWELILLRFLFNLRCLLIVIYMNILYHNISYNIPSHLLFGYVGRVHDIHASSLVADIPLSSPHTLWDRPFDLAVNVL